MGLVKKTERRHESIEAKTAFCLGRLRTAVINYIRLRSKDRG